MAKYLKHYYVDGADLTTFLTDTNIGTDGKTHPRILGLDVKFWFLDSNGIDYCLSIAPDDTEIVESSGIVALSYQDWATIAENEFIHQRTKLAEDENLLASINKTPADILAFVFDSSSVETMVQSFAQFNINQMV